MARELARGGVPAAEAWASTSARRTACMATRSAVSLKVVSRPTTSTSGFWRSTYKVQALSLPELQESSTRSDVKRILARPR